MLANEHLFFEMVAHSLGTQNINPQPLCEGKLCTLVVSYVMSTYDHAPKAVMMATAQGLGTQRTQLFVLLRRSDDVVQMREWQEL